MSTITDPRPSEALQEAAQRFLVRGAGWKAYDALAEALSDRRGPRMTYDRGDLEFMSPSPEHEYEAVSLGMVVEVAAEEWGVEYVCMRCVTLRREDLDRGLEPDNCFYTTRWRAIVGKKRFDLTQDPPPDLAIEIDVTSSSLDRQGIYAALGVPEIWRFDGESLRVFQLGPDGDYHARERSPTFPDLPLEGVVAQIAERGETHDLAWKRSFRAWLRQHIQRARGTP